MSARQAGVRLLEHIGDLQIAASLFGNEEGQRDLGRAVRLDRGKEQCAVGDHRSVQHQSPGGADLGRGVQEIQMILYCEDLSLHIVGSSQRPVDVLVFQKTRVRLPVGIDKAVQTEVGVVLELAVISAVPVHVPAGRCFAIVDGVVAPLPDKAAAQRGIFFRQIQILLEIAGAVAHCVAVFHQEERLVGIIVQIIRHLGKGGVHAAEEIDVRDVEFPVAAEIKGALVVSQPCGIRFFGPAERLLEGDSVAAFIAHGPDQNAGAIAVSQDHGSNPVQRGLDEVRIIRDPDMGQPHSLGVVVLAKIQRRRSVALIVSFVDHIETHAVAELIEPGNIRIVAGPDSVKVVGLDHAKIQQRLVHGANRTGDRIRLVAVDAAESDGLSVQGQNTVLHLHLSDSDLLDDNLPAGIHDQRVEERFFRVPEERIVYRNADNRFFALAKGDLPVKEETLFVRRHKGHRDRDGLS